MADVVVVGAGIAGLAVAFELLQDGADVVCFDPAPGSQQSVGPGRIFRLAHPVAASVADAAAALPHWRRWEGVLDATFVRLSRCTVLGEDARVHAEAMRQAGAEVEFTEQPAPMLVDRSGGVIDAEAVIARLAEAVRPVPEAVVAVEHAAGDLAVRSAAGEVVGARHVVIASGVLEDRLGDRPRALCHHYRFAIRPTASLSALEGSFLDRRRDLPSGWSFYGLRLDERTIGVGGGWAEYPFDTREWDADAALADSEREVRAWLELRGEPAAEIVGHVHCVHECPGSAAPAPYAVAHEGAVTRISGGELFKFAPLLGRSVAAVARGAGP